MKISFELRNDKQDKTGTVPIYVIAFFDGVRLAARRPLHLLRQLAQWEEWEETEPAQRVTVAGCKDRPLTV